jgi:hypothetical protein
MMTVWTPEDDGWLIRAHHLKDVTDHFAQSIGKSINDCLHRIRYMYLDDVVYNDDHDDVVIDDDEDDPSAIEGVSHPTGEIL